MRISDPKPPMAILAALATFNVQRTFALSQNERAGCAKPKLRQVGGRNYDGKVSPVHEAIAGGLTGKNLLVSPETVHGTPKAYCSKHRPLPF